MKIISIVFIALLLIINASAFRTKHGWNELFVRAMLENAIANNGGKW